MIIISWNSNITSSLAIIAITRSYLIAFKMWSLKSINFIICVCCTAIVGAEEICGQQYEVPQWETYSSFPGYLRLGLSQTLLGPALEAQVENVQENFTLTLLANPFILDENNCPPAASSYHNLRKFHKSYDVIKGGNESESIFFGKIFTGCYYAEMTNAGGKKWLWGSVFYNTSYHYYDTMLKCERFEVKPEDIGLSRELTYLIKIPLTCLRVRCQLFELDVETNNTKHDLDTGSTPATQDCWITNQGIGEIPLVECNRKDTHPKLSAEQAEEQYEGWETSITWYNLKKGGASYYALFEQYNHTCNMSYGDLMTWEPVIKFGALVHGFNNDSNTPPPEQPDFLQTPIFMIILYIFLGFSVTAILLYWMFKYAKILLESRRATNNLFVLPQEIAQLHDQKEANHILLIYARDSPQFMRAMDALRVHLQKISHYPVHDLYSINEWNAISKLGAAEWVEDLLRDGSKVVWVDTPKFRTVLKDSKSARINERQNVVDDFRDEAIPYAVTLAKDLFQNANTQYSSHFVVRLQGFEVTDRDEDPLLVVSPHTRYYIPEHLSLLCEHLGR